VKTGGKELGPSWYGGGWILWDMVGYWGKEESKGEEKKEKKKRN